MIMKDRIARKRKPLNWENGFTITEIAVTIAILGIVLAVGTLSYANVRQGTNLSGAKRQVEVALNRVKTAARQENVTYAAVFYPAPDNRYEFMRNEYDGSEWQLKPVDLSVTGETVIEESGHWYIELSGGVDITGEATAVLFMPRGTSMTTFPATVSLKIGNATGSVSIDANGRISTN